MRTTAIISSSLLAFAVSGAPVGLPKLPVSAPSFGMLEGVPVLPVTAPTAFPVAVPERIPAGLPNDIKLPFEHLPAKRAELAVVNGVVEKIKLPNLVTIPNMPKLPVDNVNLPVRRADVPVVGEILEDVTLVDGVDPKLHLSLPTSTIPANLDLIKKAVDASINTPIGIVVDDPIELPTVAVPTVTGINVPAIPAVPAPVLATRGIKQSLPVIGEASIPLDVGELQIGTADKHADELVKGTKIENLPEVARDIKQSLPIAGGVDFPLDAGNVQIGTVDKDISEVIEGTTIKNVPVLNIVKGTTVKDLPNLGRRGAKQSLPIVGGVDIPLDAGKVQVGTFDKYLGDVVKGTTTGI